MEPQIRRVGAVLLICVSLFFARPASAQESPAPEPPPADDRYDWGGAVEVGYRFTDIHGGNRYREVVNLEEGLRLFDLSLWMKDLERQGIADEVRLRLSGIGDPYPSGRLDVKKTNVYQLSVDYREYDFFSNRRDSPQSFIDPNRQLLTDNHDFDQKRRIGSINLSLFPASEVRLNFGFRFAARTGELDVPRAFTFVPNLSQDLDELFREYFGSVDFPIGGWELHVKQSVWTFDSENEIDAFPPLSEKRNESVWTYVSTIKAHTNLSDRWDFDAGYIFAHSEGESRLRISPRPVQIGSGNSDFQFDTHVLEAGLSHLLREDLIVHLDYRFHTFDQDGATTTDLFLFPQRVTETDYGLFAHTGTFQLEYMPFDNLSLKGGYRIQYREIEAQNFAENQFDGGPSSAYDEVMTHGWIASVDWKPYKFLSFFGEYQGEAFDDPYTRISPEGAHIGKLRIRYDTPIKGLNLRGTALWNRRTNPDQQYVLDVQDYVLSATYQPTAHPNLTIDASYTFEKIRDKKEIFNQAGLLPPPAPPLFSTFVFDSDAHVFSGGISYEGIYKGLGGSLSGSYARTIEENNEQYSVVSLKLWYKNPWLIPIVAFERYELNDFQKPADGFSANVITLSLRKEF